MVTINNLGKEIRVPSDPSKRKEIREFAQRQVERHGVRKRLGEYYHPPKFLRWKEYYCYCLWREMQRVQRQAAGNMATMEAWTLARQYREAWNDRTRYMVLATAYSRGGKHGVEALAQAAEVDPYLAIAAVETYLRARRRARRGQKPLVVVPPPRPAVTTDLKEARKVAEFAAGWGGENQRGRRNTLSGTTRRRAAR